MDRIDVFFTNIKAKIKKLLTIDEEDLIKMGSIEYFRDKIFSSILKFLFLFSLPIFLLGMYLFIEEGKILAAIFNIIFFIILISMFSFNIFSQRTQKTIAVSTLYLTGIFLLLSTSSYGSGMTIVLFAMIFSVVILEEKHSSKLFFINLLIFIALSFLLFQGYLDSMPIASYKTTWLINVEVVQFSGIISYLLINFIFEGLRKQIDLMSKERSKVLEGKKKYMAMISNICDVIIIVDEKSMVTYSSSNIYDIFGWKPEDLIGNSILDKIHYEDRDHIIKTCSILSRPLGFKKKIEIRYSCRDGDFKHVEATTVNLMEDPTIGGLLINFHDITETKNREEKILYLNNYDTLTAVYNRSFFERQMEEIDIEENLPISVISADIDGLKATNDSLGHLEGDKLLKIVASILKESCKKEDTVARVGGDEFYILLANTDSKAAKNIIRRINLKCQEYNITSSQAYYISVSLGSSTRYTMEKPLESCLKIADDNMYEDKYYKKKDIEEKILSSMKKNLLKKFPKLEEKNKRIAVSANEIGRAMNFSEKALENLELFVSIRDLGKIKLSKEKLSQDNFDVISEHCEAGYRIANSLPYLNCISNSILTQHANWDGSGYPKDLSGGDIDLFSRIVSVAKAYDDYMMEESIDSRETKKQAALNSIKNDSGLKFDPEIVKIFSETLAV